MITEMVREHGFEQEEGIEVTRRVKFHAVWAIAMSAILMAKEVF